MSFLFQFFKRKKSKDIAKERLKTLLKKDRRNCTENYWEYLLKPAISPEKINVEEIPIKRL